MKPQTADRPCRASVVTLFSALVAVLCPHVSAAPQAEANNPSESAITVREHIVFDGNKGWKHGGITYRLACGAAVKKAPNGDLLCWWLSGSGSEPATDNNVLMARSTDQGKTWGKPSILVPAGANGGCRDLHVPNKRRPSHRVRRALAIRQAVYGLALLPYGIAR